MRASALSHSLTALWEFHILKREVFASMLSQSTRDELRAELEHLRVERQRAIARFDAKIAAVEAILDDPGQSQTTLPLLGEQVGAAMPAVTFRGTVLTILGSYPSGLKAADLARKVEQSGFKLGGGSPMLQRIHGELYRLLKSHRIQRRNGKYFLAAPSGDKPAGAEKSGVLQ